MILRRILPLLLAFAWIGACGKTGATPKTLRVGFVPSEDAQQVIQAQQTSNDGGSKLSELTAVARMP